MVVKNFNKDDYREGQKIIIYGAGVYGEITYYCLKSWGLHASCFADRALELEEKCGIPVIRPEEVKKIKNALVLLASINYLSEISEFLLKEGINNFYGIAELLETEIDEEEMSEYAREKMTRRKEYGHMLQNMENNKFLVRNIDLVVTEYCNLRCKDCGSLIPYYKSPSHLELEEIVTPFDNFLKTIDELYELRILGGETFIYPYLDQLLDIYGKHEKIKEVVIYTNSTIVPNDSLMERIRENSVCIHMSDYRGYSSRVNELENKCKAFNIEYYIHEYNEWYDMGTVELRDYDVQMIRRIYQSCSNAKCPSFYRGCLYICPRAGHGESIGAFKNLDGEVVDFRNDPIDVEEKRKEMRHFWKEKDTFNACRYCNGYRTKPIKAAVQL